MSLIYIIIIGAICGWLGGKIMKRGGYGALLNIILGVSGSFVGSYLLDLLNIKIGNTTLINDLITGVLGTVVVLFVAGLLKK